MKVFTVVYARDGATDFSDGKRSTEVIKVHQRFAANDIEEVWERIEDIRADPELELVAVYEEHPQITVIAG